MSFDVSSYSPGDHYPDTAPAPAAPSPAAPAPTPSGAPASAPAPAGDPRYAHLAARAARDAAAPSPASEPAAEAQEQQPTEVPPYELTVPQFVDNREVTPERQEFLDQFSQVAPAAGIDAATAQGLIDAAVDAAVAFDYEARPDADLNDARAEMVRLFGDEAGQAMIRAAQEYAHSRGEKFMQFLDRTNLGNDVSILVALGFAKSGWFTGNRSEWAKEQISTLMKSPMYKSGDKLTNVKLQILSRIAHRGEGDLNEQLNSAAKAAAAK